MATLKDDLLQALWRGGEPTIAFATGGQIDEATIPASLSVEGVGRVDVPLPQQDLDKIKAAAERYRFQIWRVSASKISCPENPDFLEKAAHDIAAQALQLGMEVEVEFSEMFLMESGSEPLMFVMKSSCLATMIIQLPTQSGHSGGKLTISHEDSSKEFNFHSRTDCYHAIFFRGCRNKLAEVTKGSRVCLVFRLLAKKANFLSVDNFPFFASTSGRVKSLLQRWVATSSPSARDLMVVPLGHSYSSMSFHGLKGHDRVVTALVMNCDFLELHLCTLTKRVKQEIENYWVENWVSATDDLRIDYGRWNVLDIDVLRSCSGDKNEPFMSSSVVDDEVDVFHVAALVVWPASRKLQVFKHKWSSLKKNLRSLIARVLEKHLARLDSTEAKRDVHNLVCVLQGQNCNSGVEVEVWAQVLDLCCKSGLEEDAVMLVKAWGNYDPLFWTPMSKLPWDDVKKCMISFRGESGRSMDLVMELKSVGREDDALELAKLLARHVHYDVKILEFCLSYGLKDEVTEILKDMPIEKIAVAAHREEYREAVELRIGSMEKASNYNSYGSGAYNLDPVARMILKVAGYGSHDLATAFASKLQSLLPNYIDPRNIQGEPFLAAFLLSRELVSYEVAFDCCARDRKHVEPVAVITGMKDAAGFIGLKETNKNMARLFKDLCLRVLEHKQVFDEEEDRALVEYNGSKKPELQGMSEKFQEFVEAVLWFGDEGMIAAMVDQLVVRIHLTWKLLDKECGLVQRVVSFGVPAATEALRYLVEARRDHLRRGVRYGMDDMITSCPPRKRARICGTDLDPDQVKGNPRLLRVVCDIRKEQWEAHASLEVNYLENLLDNDLKITS